MRKALLLVACVACHPDPVAKPPVIAPPVAPPVARVDPELLRTLSILATERAPAPAELAQVAHAIDDGKNTIARYIDGLLDDGALAREVVPLVILRKLLGEAAYGAPSAFVLKQTAGVYHLYKPCAANTAVRVHPWWALDTELAVCPDSYLPKQWTQKRPKGEPEISCLSEYAAYQEDGGQRCGCGPNLVRCFRDDAHRAETVASLRGELTGTVGYVTQQNLPLETMFTANETWRDRNAETVRRMHVVEAKRDAHPEAFLRELAAWPAAGAWSARTDFVSGQNAGILTTPELVFFMPDRRQRMTYIYDVAWCMEADSFGATPEALIGIKNPDIQIASAGWKELAARPLCTNCHARLDYGMQYFWGFPNANLQAFFLPDLQLKGRGPLYAHDLSDGRGEGELNPQSFAKLAVAQPEFKRCMARDFAEWALGTRTTAADITALEQTIRANVTTPRQLMRATLQLVVARWSAVRSVPREPPAPAIGAKVEVTTAMHQLLEDDCLGCHDADPARVDLSPRSFERGTVVRLLDEVAFARMPKDHGLAPATRDAMLTAFIAATWSGADAEAATTFYRGRLAGLAVFPPAVMFRLVHHTAGASTEPHWRMLENSVRSDVQQASPGAAATLGLEAIEACRAAHPHDRPAIQRCLSDAVRADHLVNDLNSAPLRGAAQPGKAGPFDRK